MEVGEFAFPIDPVENLIRGMGQGAYRGRRGKGGYSQSLFPRRIHFLLLIRLFREIASDKLDELDDDFRMALSVYQSAENEELAPLVQQDYLAAMQLSLY